MNYCNKDHDTNQVVLLRKAAEARQWVEPWLAYATAYALTKNLVVGTEGGSIVDDDVVQRRAEWATVVQEFGTKGH